MVMGGKRRRSGRARPRSERASGRRPEREVKLEPCQGIRFALLYLS
jgi:hypothetical protein